MKKIIVLSIIVGVSLASISTGTMRTHTPFLSNTITLDSVLIIGKRINVESSINTTSIDYLEGINSIDSIKFIPKNNIDSLILKYATLEGVPAILIKAQDIEESNSGTSKVAKRCKNRFGHRYGIFNKKTRKTKYYYKVYDTMEACIKYHASLLRRMYEPSTGGNDIDFWLISLKGYNKGNNQYADNPCYVKNLINVIKQFKVKKS